MESAAAGPLLSSSFVLEARGYIEASVNKSAIVVYSGTDTLDAPEGVLVTLSLRAAETAPAGTFAVAFDEGASGISNEDGTVSVPHTTTDGSITVRKGGGIVICAPRHGASRGAALPDAALLLFLVSALVLEKRGRVPLRQCRQLDGAIRAPAEGSRRDRGAECCESQHRPGPRNVVRMLSGKRFRR